MPRPPKKTPLIKKCITCNEEFPIRRSKHAQKYCTIACGSKDRFQKAKKKYPNDYFKEKQCRKCGTTFVPEAPSQHYCSQVCRGKESYYKRNYNITGDELKAMKIDQGHKCYICGGEGFILGSNNHTERLVVDHCHSTGKVGKLLCQNCNRGLGLFKDDTRIMKEAIRYLEEYR